MTQSHISVLLQETIDSFSDVDLKIFVDATCGAGGHSSAILERYPSVEKLIGIDQDPVALAIAEKRLQPWKEKVSLLSGNFSIVLPELPERGIDKVDGIVMDLGVSSMQLDMAEKGFSFMKDGPLDMRMDPSSELTAADIINDWSEHEIAKIIRDYGEEKQWRQAAKTIAEARKKGPITTTNQLAEILRPIFAWKKKGINPLTLVFQALRIRVNNELEVLESVLPSAIDMLSPGGRLAVISFHSLEDRIVKNAFRYAASDKYDTSGIGGVFLDKDPIVKLVTRKPIIPGDEEIEANPRSRSAKLRVVEKL